MIEKSYGAMNAGRYDEALDMGRFASGVYFYKIYAHGNDGQSYVSVRKLIRVK